MRRHALLAAVLCVAPLGVGVVDVDAQVRPRQEEAQERRARLEREVRSRFIEAAARRLELDARQQEQLDEVLRTGAEARRSLARESGLVRRRLAQAVSSDETAPATFESLLRDLDRLRQRELELERQEQARLAAFLDPRQRATLLTLRMRLNEQVRRMRTPRP